MCVGGGGVIGQPFVQFCFRRFAPSVVCSVFSVSTYFPLMDIDLDMPHTVPDDSDDDEGGYIWPTADGSHIQLRELPNYKYDVSSALIWFRAKRVPEADNAADQPPAKKEKGTALFDAEVTGRKVS